MKLFEFQVKDIFKDSGIIIPDSILAINVENTVNAAKKVGFPCVLKAQVLTGGRGKAGLIKFVNTEVEAEENAKELFSNNYKVKKILVEKAVDIEKEIYISVTIDPYKADMVIMACKEGGIDIETIANKTPDKIIIEHIDANLSLQEFQINNIIYSLGIDSKYLKDIAKTIRILYEIFNKYDAELVEINPLFISKDGDMLAGDGKLIIDDNSMYRQKNYEMTRDYFDNDVEYEAAKEGIPYLQFDGDISLMCAGAGLTTTVYDLINYEGGTIANYLEFGGPNYKKAEKAMELCLKNKSKVILVVTFGTIARADIMAQGVVEAMNKLKPDRPIVTCIRGTNEEEAHRILRRAGLDCIEDTEEAVKTAVNIAKGE